jgi:hypothetical protein
MPTPPSENPEYSAIERAALKRLERALEAVKLAEKKVKTAENDLEAAEMRLEGAKMGVRELGLQEAGKR